MDKQKLGLLADVLTGNDKPRGLLALERQAKQGLLSNYSPSLRERMVDALARNWYGDSKEGTRKAERLSNIMELTPLGLAPMAYDAGREAGKGNYGTAGVMGAMAFVPGAKVKSFPAFKGMHPYNETGEVIDLRKGPQQHSWSTNDYHAGFHASNPDVANHFAEWTTKTGAVFPNDIQFNSPLVIDGKGKRAADFQFVEGERGYSKKWQSYFTSPEYAEYDGVILKNVKDAGGVTDIYIPKDPEQIQPRFRGK